MPLIPYVDLTEIALFRNSDERSEHRDFISACRLGPGWVVGWPEAIRLPRRV